MIDDEELNELYQALVLEHSKKPFNFGTIPGITAIHGKNPSCGDKIDLYIQLEKNNLHKMKFEGEGCALCIASTSLMIKNLQGKNKQEAKHVFTLFSQLLHGDIDSVQNEEYESLDVFKQVHNFPSRVKCAMLGWRALEVQLNKSDSEDIER